MRSSGGRGSKTIFRENLFSRVSAFEDEDGERKSEGENEKKKEKKGENEAVLVNEQKTLADKDRQLPLVSAVIFSSDAEVAPK